MSLCRSWEAARDEEYNHQEPEAYPFNDAGAQPLLQCPLHFPNSFWVPRGVENIIDLVIAQRNFPPVVSSGTDALYRLLSSRTKETPPSRVRYLPHGPDSWI